MKWVAVCVGLPLLLYVGAYYALVTPTPMRTFPNPSADQIVPAYPNDFWYRVLSPMHHIDRRLRPRVWELE